MPNRHTRRTLAVGTLALVLAGSGATAWAVGHKTGPSYRYATAELGSVTQSMTATGTISPIKHAGADFQVAGTVSKVLVHQGQSVRSGQVLARLNRADLRTTVANASATLNQAQQSLASAEAGESAATSNAVGNFATNTASSGADTAVLDSSHVTAVAAKPTASATARPSAKPTTRPTASPTARPTASPTGSGSASNLAAAIAADQARVVAGQHKTDMDLATSSVALKAETTACAAEISGGATPSTSACSNAATTLLGDQQSVAADEALVETAEATLDNDLARALKSVRAVSSQSSTSSHSTTRSQRTSTSHATSSVSSARTTTVTASTLAADEATIDTARGSLSTARADLAEATLRSPISGKVTAISVAVGDSVSGQSSSTQPAVDLVGSRLSEVTVGLSAAQVRQVRVGMRAQTTADGTTTMATGRVSTIATTETSSSSSSTEAATSSYPVTIDLATPTAAVAGAAATVTITTASATNVLTVPTSALHQSGSVFSVNVLKKGKVAPQRVTVGAKGAALTEIRSGLSRGQQVILANLKAAVPSSSTNLTSNRRGGFSGSAGGGFIGGAPGGGTPGSGRFGNGGPG